MYAAVFCVYAAVFVLLLKCWKQSFIYCSYNNNREHIMYEFDAGRFYDCGSAIAVSCMMKIFLDKLVEPLVPYSYYASGLSLVGDHLNRCTQDLLEDDTFRSVALSHEDEGIWEMNFKSTYKRQGIDLVYLAGLVESYAFYIDQDYADITKWFNSLPETNRHTLEYLCIGYSSLLILVFFLSKYVIVSNNPKSLPVLLTEISNCIILIYLTNLRYS